MDFIEYETKKYQLYRNMERKHVGAFRRLRNSDVRGAFNIKRAKEDMLKLNKLIKKYKSKIKHVEESEYGDIIVSNYNSRSNK